MAKFRRKNKSLIKIKYILFLVMILVSFLFFINIFYIDKFSKLSNEEIIDNIIYNLQFKDNRFSKYKDSFYILSNVLNIKYLDITEVVNDNYEASIYIYNTHDTESYLSNSIEPYNVVPNIKLISYIFKDYLDDLGMSTLVEDKSVDLVLKENNWPYRKSYDVSREFINERLSINDYDLVIDLHRDSSSLDKTLLLKDDLRYAKILFVVGKDNTNYQINYELALSILNILESLIPGITRGISLKGGEGVNGIYNQDLSNKMILIELGGQYNEIEDLNNSLKVLSKAILMYMEEYNGK